jgi:hypothetical protein
VPYVQGIATRFRQESQEGFSKDASPCAYVNKGYTPFKPEMANNLLQVQDLAV